MCLAVLLSNIAKLKTPLIGGVFLSSKYGQKGEMGMGTWEIVILTLIVVFLAPLVIRFAFLIIGGIILIGVSAIEVIIADLDKGKKKKNKK